jgi:lipid kinase YegS
MRARLILNGKKADRSDVRAAVMQLRASGHELEVRVTWERGDAARLVAEATREGIERVIAGGGDGSVNEVAAGLMAVDASARPALGILPLGTANDFATACRIPVDAAAALALAVTAAPVAVDLGQANGSVFANVAAGGFGAAVTAETPVELKNFLGGGAYTIMGLLKAIDFRPYACGITTPAGAVEGSVVVGAICNGRQAGGGQPLAPDAVLDDGLLDIVSLREFPASAAVQVVSEILANRSDGEYVERIRTPWIEVTAPAPIPVNLDGEPMTGTSFRFACEPGCVRMVLPMNCPCLRDAQASRG